MSLPKAELHVHLEGTARPSLLKKLALRNQLTFPEEIIGPNDTLQWSDFHEFLHVYDVASRVIKTPEDYYDITYDYLKRSAEENVVYVELTSSPNHAALNGLSYQDHLTGTCEAIVQAKKDFAIEARILIVCVRQFGVEKAIRVAELVATHPHPFVVGLNLAGDEINFPAKQFAPAFDIAAKAQLHCTAHAGEIVGAESIWQTINYLPVSRIGHGVRAIDDEILIGEIIARGITLEICPTSNIALGLFPDYAHHSAPQLYEKGVKITLNSDDPPYFATTIGHEYALAKQHFGFSDKVLKNITQIAIENSFAEEALKTQLLEKL